MNVKEFWDYCSVSAAMIKNAKEHGVLPLDFDPTTRLVHGVIDDQYHEAAHRMMEISGYEYEPVEDLLWDLFGISFSSAAKRVLAENEGIVIPLNYDVGCFYCDPNLLPMAVRTIACPM